MLLCSCICLCYDICLMFSIVLLLVEDTVVKRNGWEIV